MLALAFSPDGKLLASAGACNVTAWRAVHPLGFSPDVKPLASAGTCDVTASRTVHPLGFSPDFKLLASRVTCTSGVISACVVCSPWSLSLISRQAAVTEATRDFSVVFIV